jgi:hypothetical protein
MPFRHGHIQEADAFQIRMTLLGYYWTVLATPPVAGWAMVIGIQCPPYQVRYAGTLPTSLEVHTAASTAVDVVISREQALTGYSTLVIHMEV